MSGLLLLDVYGRTLNKSAKAERFSHWGKEGKTAELNSKNKKVEKCLTDILDVFS